MSVTLIFKNRTRRRYGSEEPDRFVEGKKGHRSTFILSDGALEKSELDDIEAASAEDEEDRIKRRTEMPSQTKIAIGNLATLARAAKPGHRAATIRKIKQSGGLREG